MDEREYIKNEFGKAFSEWESKPIALYGLSANSGAIIESFPSYRIVGLLDGYQQEGEMYGCPIISLRQVLEFDVKAIIIIARASSVTLIANRVAKFCRENGVSLFDVHGKDCLTEVIVESNKLSDHPVRHLSIEKAKKAIETHEIISFDIFDTLLMRRLLLPEDVFTLVEQRTGMIGFAEARVKAEREENRLASERGDAATLSGIYDVLRLLLGLKDGDVKELQKVELEIEMQSLVPRRQVIALLDYASKFRKRLFLISDMYWPEKFLRHILDKFYINGWTGLYLSSTRGCAKASGLYELFCNENVADSYLHIGDNSDTDVEFPRMAGFDTLQLYSVRDMFAASTWRAVAHKPVSLPERTMIGMLSKHLYHNPWILANSDGRPTVKGGEDFGYVFVAPMLTGFLFWFLRETCGTGGHLLFVARDGWLLARMYDVLQRTFPDKQWLPSSYFYTSRSAAVSAWCETEEDVRYVAALPFAGKPQELLRDRFFIDERNILPLSEGESLGEYISKHLEIIISKAAELRQNYRLYFSKCGIGRNERLKMIDFVASGTCQMCLERILEKKISGYYFIRHLDEQRSEKNAMATASFIEDGYLYDLHSYLAKNYYPLENTIIGVKPSVAFFSAIGEPVFQPESRNELELRFLTEVEKGVLAFFREYIILLGNKPDIIRHDFVDQLYSLIENKYTKIVDNIYEKTQVKDEFFNRTYKIKLT